MQEGVVFCHGSSRLSLLARGFAEISTVREIRSRVTNVLRRLLMRFWMGQNGKVIWTGRQWTSRHMQDRQAGRVWVGRLGLVERKEGR